MFSTAAKKFTDKEIAERINQLREDKKLNNKELAKELGMKPTYFSKIVNAQQPVSLKYAKVLVEKFNISLNWLFLGIGSMYLIDKVVKYVNDPPKQHFVQEPLTTYRTSPPAIPLVDIRAAAGYPQMTNDSSYMNSLPTIRLPFPEVSRGEYIAIQIEGNSMEERIQHLDYTVCKRVYEPSELRRGNIYTVVFNDGILCKRLISLKGSHIFLSADNPLYGDEQIHSDNLIQLWEVKYIISSNMRSIAPIGALNESFSSSLQQIKFHISSLERRIS